MISRLQGPCPTRGGSGFLEKETQISKTISIQGTCPMCDNGTVPESDAAYIARLEEEIAMRDRAMLWMAAQCRNFEWLRERLAVKEADANGQYRPVQMENREEYITELIVEAMEAARKAVENE